MIRRLLTFAALAALLSALAACGTKVQRSYYSLQYNLGDDLRVYQQYRYPIVIRVERFQSSIAYDRAELVYRTNAHEFKYDYYRLWAAKPRKMIRELVAAHLRHTDLFQSVVLNIGDRIPEYELKGEVVAIEELDASRDVWFAHLAMRFSLVRFEDGKRVWEYSFDERRQVYNRLPVHVVRTLSEILEEEMVKITHELDGFFEREHGAPVPEGGRLVHSGAPGEEGGGEDGGGEDGGGEDGGGEDGGGEDGGGEDGDSTIIQPGAKLKSKSKSKKP